jgi:ribosomal protein S18 acetylase RimI-like enzyme
MPDASIEPLLGWWRAQDDRFDRVERSWWGAVISDPRYPDVQEANYARVEARSPVSLAEVEGLLIQAMDRTANGRTHVVVFHPADQTDLLVEASTGGERLAWDIVMEHRSAPPEPAVAVERVTAFDGPVARLHRTSMAWFGITDEHVIEQLVAMELDVMLPAGRIWFTVREGQRPVALAALLVLEGAGYIDHVATEPAARRRGYATALACRAVAEARSLDAERTYLLADPEGDAAHLYERIGFRPVTRIASWISARQG